MREKFTHYIREDELVDNELMEFRVIVHEQLALAFVNITDVVVGFKCDLILLLI